MSIKNLEIKPSEAKSVEIASLPTRPTSSATYGGRGLTAQEMKKAYDAYPALIKERFNALIADLLSGIAINDIPFSIPAHEPFGENIEQTVKGFLDAVGDILDFGTDNARTIFGFVKKFVNDVAKATSLEYDKSTKLLSLTIDGQEKSVTFDDISTLQTNVGTLQTDMSVAKNDIADLKSSKLDKTGGTISGNLEVTGNLNVLGKTIESVLEKLNVKDAVIVTNADGSTLTVLSGFATRTDSNTTYGIMYEPASDSVKLGIVTVNENGVYRFADGEGSPVATRADSADMADGKVIKWNASNRRMETTAIPAVVDDTPTESSSNLITSGAVWQSEEDVISLVFNVGNGWAIHYEKDSDVIVLRNSFTSSESSVVLGIKDINDRVDFLSTLLFNTIITNTTVEDTYTSRVTAGGLPVVSNTPTTVHRIAGDTKPSENMIDESLFLPWAFSTTKISEKQIAFTISAGTYTVSNIVEGVETLKNVLGIYLVNDSNNVILSCNAAGNSGVNVSSTFTVTEEVAKNTKYLRIHLNPADAEYNIKHFMLNKGATALPYSDYYAGLKNAAFKGVTSTGINLVDFSDATEGKLVIGTGSIDTTNNYWFTPVAYFPCVAGQEYQHTTEYRTTMFKTAVAAFYDEAKTFISAQQISGNSPYLSVVAPRGAQYMRWSFSKVGDPGVKPTQPMVYIRRMDNIPAYAPYVGDTTFSIASPIMLGKWDYIDVDKQKQVVCTVTETQDTPYTEEQLAQFDEYILSTDGKMVAYRTAAPTETALSLPKTYLVWNDGQETIIGNPSGLSLTVNQNYYEEVTA